MSQALSDLQSHIQKNALKGHFAVVKLWPHLTVAEHENIMRIQRVAQSLNLKCSVVNPYGELEGSPGSFISQEELDFVLQLHFASPKAIDCYSILALWNPPDFHYQLGYRKSVRNMMSHDDFLSSGSPWADDQIRRLNASPNIQPSEDFALYNSIGGPFLEPGIGEKRLFYVGINWEKLGERKKRHSRLLKLLDDNNKIRIFGPRIFHDVDIWKGFKNYAGEIPFDGRTIIQRISECGVGLSLSSDAHLEAEMPSNRIFECCAAGVPVISDRNNFVMKHFEDSVLYVDSKKEVAEVHAQIKKHLQWIENYPEEAIKLAERSQNIFKEKFELGSCLRNIYLNFEKRRLHERKTSRMNTEPREVQLICLNLQNSLSDMRAHINSIKMQNLPGMHLHYVIKKENTEVADQFMKDLEETKLDFVLVEVDEEQMTKSNFLGALVYDRIKHHPQIPFCILGQTERMFQNHLHALLDARNNLVKSEYSISCAVSDYILEKNDATANPEYIADIALNINERKHFELGRYLYTFSEKAQYKYLDQLNYFNKELTAFLVSQSEVSFTNKGTLITRGDRMYHELSGDALRELEFISDFAQHRPEYKKASEASFLEDVRPNKFSLENMSEENKKEIIVELANSIPMPGFAKKMIFGTYRSWLNKKKQR